MCFTAFFTPCFIVSVDGSWITKHYFFFQELYIPGILYYVSGGYAMICIISCYFLPETKDLDLNDNLESPPAKVRPAESSTHM